jgi:hypothetical protein
MTTPIQHELLPEMRPACPLGCTETPQHQGRRNRLDVWFRPECGCLFEILQSGERGRASE